MAIVTATVDKIKTAVPDPFAVEKYTEQSAAAASDLAGMSASTQHNSEMFDELVGSMAGQAKEMMTGAVPDDVQKQIRQMAAENVIKGGQGMGSQASKFITARDLGLTSLDVMQKGQTLGIIAKRWPIVTSNMDPPS